MSAAKRTKKHPLAGTMMSGADMIVQVLVDEGLDTVFGYNGGAILPTYDAVFRYNESRSKEERLGLVVPATEQGAGFMAAGYARATGKVGAFMVTSGPGATNCVTPIRDCMADSVPVVLICGQVARPSIGTDAFQEAPVFNIMSACAKHVFLVSDETQLEATVRTAFHIARTGRPGPVVIDVPKDIQNHESPFRGEGRLELKGYDRRMEKLANAGVSPDEAKGFFKLLGASKRPLIYAGGGVVNGNAAEELRAFVRRFHIPVVTTLMGIGSIDTRDPVALHMLGMHGLAYANYAVEDCDFLFAVGARFDDRVAGKVDEFAPNAKIAHVDIDAAEIGKVMRVDWSHVSPAKTALRDLLWAGKDFKRSFSPWLRHVGELKKKHRLDYDRDNEQVQPQEVLSILNELTQGNAVICTGVGQHQMWAAQYCDFHEPRTFITSGSMGTMGFGLPSTIGAQYGRPDKMVIDVDGDGSLRMNIGELETATNYNVPVKILLLNNRADGMVLQWQDLYFGHRFCGTDKMKHKKDFVKEAEANGFRFARRVTASSDLRKALGAFLKAKGPAFLEVWTDQSAHVYPMVGPALGYKGMLTGPHIPDRKDHEPDLDFVELGHSDSF